jgi:cation:H+ antiporter
MPIPDFRAFSLSINLAIFGGAAVVVWLAGTRLAYYADAISDRTKLSKAFLGLILLGVATSLPEIVTTITGALLDNPALVAGNLFGGVAMQIAILAVVDMVAMRRALTFFTPQPVLLFQGVMLLLLLSVALAGVAAGDPVSVAGFGLTPILLVAGYVLTVSWSRPGAERLPRWRATNVPSEKEEGANSQREEAGPLGSVSNTRLSVMSAASAAAILVAGWGLAQTGDALAEQTGLGASFVGVALVAASTSLPELSTALAAVRQGNHQMAVSNILGTNCLEVALFFLADTFYRSGPILASTDQSALFAAALGSIVTCIYLLGLLERRDRTIFRMGYDSVAVLVVYGTGLVGLYFMR